MTRKSLPRSEAGFFSIILIIIFAVVVLVVVLSLTNHKAGTHLGISNGCTDTDIVLQPIVATKFDTPMTLQATLTTGGKPVGGERVTFRAVGSDNHQHQLQDLVGYATTDDQGVSKLTLPDGFADEAITFGPGGTIAGYGAEFDGASAIKPNEPFYCGSHAASNFPHTLTVQ